MKKRNLIILISLAVIVVFIATNIVIGQIKKPLPYEFVVIKKQTVTQEVSVTGKVKPAESVDLAFEKGGKIKKVYVDVGDNIEQGQNLVALDTSELQAQLEQAQANLETQQAKLTELQKGTRPEELQVYQTKLSNAQKDFDDAKTELANVKSKADSDLANLYDDVKDTLSDAYTKSDDAVNKQTQELFSNANSSSPQLTFYCSNYQLETDSQNKRVIANNAVADLKNLAGITSADYSLLDNSLNKAAEDLNEISDFLSTVDSALNFAANLSASTITTYKGYTNTGRTNVDTALTSVNTLKQSITSQKITNQKNIDTEQASYNSAKNDLDVAQGDLELKIAGSTPEAIQAQEAQATASQANVNNIAAQIAKSTIKAPIGGIITKQEAKVGEISQAGAVVVSLISQSDFEIEANIPEADIAKVKIGDTAKITLDAYGADTIFEAKVTKIDPAETVIEGVATYKTTLQFIQNDERIKSGLTANADILTNQKEGVIAVPYRAVVSKDGSKIVKVLVGKKTEERKVEIGLRGSDGNIEIMNGLNEGEKAITFEKK
ncbi:MAG: efflux RND transporter periplasmic adaptor subunit [Candidatus Pacebacteria bacterium]|nr:efflux RND transporter periplasmic adaptor subunit [Candidatus Paceibacterota bacterium]